MSTALAMISSDHWSEVLTGRIATTGHVVFTQHGVLERDDIDRALALAEAHCETASVAISVKKRLLNLVIEGLENIRHHASADLAHSAFAVLVHQQDGFRFAFGNAAPQVIIASLSHRVGILNEMDEADLREHLLKLLSNSGRTERGGAGLGLLTMARKCSGPIVVHSFPRDALSGFLAFELVLAD